MRSLPSITPSAADHDRPIGLLSQKIAERQDLEPREHAALAALLDRDVRDVRHRAAIVEAGVAGEVAVLLEGWACRVAPLASGKRRIIAFYLPGDLCNFEAFHSPRAEQTVLAIGGVRVAAIAPPALGDLMRHQPRLAQALWQDAMATAAIQRAWTINVGQRAASKRLAHLFCELHTRLAQVGLANRSGCAFPLTQADLGDACALTSIHTNRAIQEMRRDGLIELYAGRLRIHDWDALAALGEFDAGYLRVADEDPAPLAIRAAR